MRYRSSDRRGGRVAEAFALVAVVSACMPSTDLDGHARGEGNAPMAAAAGGAAEPPLGDGAGMSSGMGVSNSNGESTTPVALDPGGNGGSSGAVAPGTGSTGGVLPDAGDTAPVIGDAGPPLSPDPPIVSEPPVAIGPAPALPDDLIDAPVSGEIVFSDEAEWEVDGVFQPTFEIRTPTASFWVVKPLGTIVSIEDAAPTPEQWVAFSSGFRPLRGVPSFPTPPTSAVSTVRDLDSQTPTHVRLTAETEDAAWQWVWDFYVTHVTFTINRAPVPFGFAYQGVPGGSLGAEDRLISNEGVSQGARSSFNGDLAGPVEWAYLADTDLGRSLFAIQHTDDALPEHYQVRDNDTALLLFGNGQIEQLPMRFSLGIIPSVAQEAVSARVEFIAAAIH
jgi:hypothetical protein